MSQANQSLHPVILCLGVATAPFLSTLLIAHEIARGLGELGEASEEIFRGDRLPILNFPNTNANPELS